MSTYVISDTHFNHANILKFKDKQGNLIRPEFTDVRQMDDHMVDRWNSTVSARDTVFHLGDVFMRGTLDFDYLDTLLGSLNGKKYLILGNHDNACSPLLQKHFSKIMGGTVDKKTKSLLTHYPTTFDQDDQEKRSYDINIHGHIHRNPSPTLRHICVSVEQIDYTPVKIVDQSKYYYFQLGKITC